MCSEKKLKDILILTQQVYRLVIYVYIGCPGKNVPDFWRMFLKLKYNALTKNTYIQN